MFGAWAILADLGQPSTDISPVVSTWQVTYTAKTAEMPRIGGNSMEESQESLTIGQWLALAAAFLGWMFDGVEIGLFPLVGRAALQDLLGLAAEEQIMAWMSRITACFLVGASPALLALLVLFFVPESERWKTSARKGGRSPIIAIFQPGVLSKTLFAMVLSGIPLIGTWAAVSAYIPNWVDDMSQAQGARTLLSGDTLTKYEAIKNPKEKRSLLRQSLTDKQWSDVRRATARSKAVVSLILAIGAILGCLAASTVGGKYGRRPVYFGMCLLSFLSASYLFRFLESVASLLGSTTRNNPRSHAPRGNALAPTLCDTRADAEHRKDSGSHAERGNQNPVMMLQTRFLTEFNAWFLLVAFVVGGITAAFYGWLPLYLPELFPTRIRATGQGLSFNFGRVLAAGGTLCLGQLFGLFGGDYGRAMAAVAMVYLLGMVVVWFAPETKGKPLPD